MLALKLNFASTPYRSRFRHNEDKTHAEPGAVAMGYWLSS